MRYSTLFLFLIGLAIASCHQQTAPSPPPPVVEEKIPEKPDKSGRIEPGNIELIAFGSCNKIDLPQRMWTPILQNKPDLWVWLGDILYADTENMNKMAAYYKKQKNKEGYKKLIKNCTVLGIWDDHDYGMNDGGKNYSKKNASKKLLLDFLDVPKNEKVWKRPGVYQSYTFGEPGKRVKIILLDTRYFRDDLKKSLSTKRRYSPNKKGTILGEQQWDWLERELKNSTAQINIIASSIQVLPKEHRFEKWDNFPKERTRLLRLIQSTSPQKAILISGDRHISEISKIKLKKLPYLLYEITSSSLTHARPKPEGEPNQYRVGKLVDKNNFSVLRFDWSQKEVKVKVEIRGRSNNIYETQDLF